MSGLSLEAVRAAAEQKLGDAERLINNIGGPKSQITEEAESLSPKEESRLRSLITAAIFGRFVNKK